jgi:release factor glutamine methyltransferase
MPSLLLDITSSLEPLSDTPALDASVLLAHILRKPRSWVLAHPELTLTNEQQCQLNECLALLESGEPFPYVLGHWEFFGLDFEVTPDVLIPRPETELLVEKVIARLQELPARKIVADIGTGSGAIPVSIAVSVPNTKVLATDISEKALEVAKRNAQKHAVSDRIRFIQCDLLPDPKTPAQGLLPINIICANLPYIPTDMLYSLPVYGREPTIALDGGEDGLRLIQRLLKLAPAWLAPGGSLWLEIEATLGTPALDLARRFFPLAELYLHQDLTGRDRLLEVALP